MIHKPNSKEDEIKNYRPISLLNTDYKLFAKILANRLKKVLNYIIHTDQSGFLPKRKIQNNIRNIINVLEYYELHPGKPMILTLLEAEKAFDNINWDYTLQKNLVWGCGNNFYTMIKAIYNSQNAKILVNGEPTNGIPIQKGTRQGCPLSPLLFIFTIESLAERIQKNEKIKGLKVKGETFKLQVFANDMIFILEEPEHSLIYLLDDIQEYGNIAGFRINISKTKILAKNCPQKVLQSLKDISEIKVVQKAKYLGIWFTNNTTTLYENNYLQLIKDINRDLNIGIDCICPY